MIIVLKYTHRDWPRINAVSLSTESLKVQEIIVLGRELEETTKKPVATYKSFIWFSIN